MKEGLTEVIILHDNNAPVAGFTDFGNTARKCISSFLSSLKKLDTEIRVTFANFGGGYKLSANDVPAAAVKLSAKYFTGAGTRDVFDCIGVLMNEKGRIYSEADPAEHPENVIFVIIAFGRDNASKNFTYSQIADMIEHQSKWYKWKFFCLTAESSLHEQLGILTDSVICMNTEYLHAKHKRTENHEIYGENAEFLSKALEELAGRIKGLIN